MYILLILSFLLLTLILFYYKKRENFVDETIYSEKNVFINNKQPLDIDTINVNRLCIKDENGVECINKSELFNALELPIFRKHTYCIDDACITKNNLKKIKGQTTIKLKSVNDDSKCVGFSNIPASLSLRTQKKWETDKIGLRVGINNTKHPEYHRISYHSLYEPKDGWKLNPKDYCNQKHRNGNTGGLCNQKDKYPDKGYCKKNFGKYDYDNVKKYGCNARHRSSPGVCWESAGRRCNNLRKMRKGSYDVLYKPENRTQVDSDMKNIPTLDIPSMKDELCNSDNTSMNFIINNGKLKSDINGLIGSEISTKYYRNISPHENHISGNYK
jgi:hypothetical protein